MPKTKAASSQAAWALLTQGVSSARLEAHRLKHLTDRALALIESSEGKEHFYQVAGDIIVALPKRLDVLEIHLDRTGLALAKMGDEFLSARLPLADKTLIDDAIDPAFGLTKDRHSDAVRRVVGRFLAKQAK